MLDLNPEIVCGIIIRAQEFHAKEGIVYPDEPTDDAEDWARQILEDHEDDQTLQELNNVIAELEPDQQVSLVALMWLGRGDFGAEEWESALTQARQRWTPRTAEYLIGTPLVADYLAEGLSQLGYSCED